MPFPAYLVPALTGFALSKLTGQSTKKSLRNALLAGLTGGLTEAATAPAAAANVTKESVMQQMMNAPVGTSQLPQAGGAVTQGIAAAKEGLQKPLFDIFGKTVTGGDALKSVSYTHLTLPTKRIV